MEIGNEIGQKIRSAIKAKLIDLGAYVDDELPDYVMVMVANKKTHQQMTDDLNLFLCQNTMKFTTWLHNLLNKLFSLTNEVIVNFSPSSNEHGGEIKESQSSKLYKESKSIRRQDKKTSQIEKIHHKDHKGAKRPSNIDEDNLTEKKKHKSIPIDKINNKPCDDRGDLIKLQSKSSDIKNVKIMNNKNQIKIPQTNRNSEKNIHGEVSEKDSKRKLSESLNSDNPNLQISKQTSLNESPQSTCNIKQKGKKLHNKQDENQHNEGTNKKENSESNKNENMEILQNNDIVLSKDSIKLIYANKEVLSFANKDQSILKEIEQLNDSMSIENYFDENSIKLQTDEDMFEEETPLQEIEDLKTKKLNPTEDTIKTESKKISSLLCTVAPQKKESKEEVCKKRPNSNVTPSVIGAVIKHHEEEESDKETFDKRLFGNILSVIKVSDRKFNVPACLQANRNLLIDAMKQAEESVAKIKKLSEYMDKKDQISNSINFDNNNLSEQNQSNRSNVKQRLGNSKSKRLLFNQNKQMENQESVIEDSLFTVKRLDSNIITSNKTNSVHNLKTSSTLTSEEMIKTSHLEDLYNNQKPVQEKRRIIRIVDHAKSVLPNLIKEKESSEVDKSYEKQNRSIELIANPEYDKNLIKKNIVFNDENNKQMMEDESDKEMDHLRKILIKQQHEKQSPPSKNFITKFIVTLDKAYPLSNERIDDKNSDSIESNRTSVVIESDGDSEEKVELFNESNDEYILTFQPEQSSMYRAAENIVSNSKINAVNNSLMYEEYEPSTFINYNYYKDIDILQKKDLSSILMDQQFINTEHGNTFQNLNQFNNDFQNNSTMLKQRPQSICDTMNFDEKKILSKNVLNKFNLNIQSLKDGNLKQNNLAQHQNINPKISAMSSFDNSLYPVDKLKNNNSNLIKVDKIEKVLTDKTENNNECDNSKNDLVEKCKFFPSCKNGEKCSFHHPTILCKTFPYCRFGDKCSYLHPICKFDKVCTKPHCLYMHTVNKPSYFPAIKSSSMPIFLQPAMIGGFSLYSPPIVGENFRNLPPLIRPPLASKVTLHPSKVKCRFFPKCTEMNCPFLHPKPCRYGFSCTDMNTCCFTHPSLPSKDKFTWKPMDTSD